MLIDIQSDLIFCWTFGLQLFETKAQLSIGEIKSSTSSYGAGVVQLERRLALLQWAVQHLRGTIKQFTKVGARVGLPSFPVPSLVFPPPSSSCLSVGAFPFHAFPAL
jgi:hypothetical protein